MKEKEARKEKWKVKIKFRMLLSRFRGLRPFFGMRGRSNGVSFLGPNHVFISSLEGGLTKNVEGRHAKISVTLGKSAFTLEDRKWRRKN